MVNKNTGRVHTSYNQTVTATGRLSSSNPNLQNIPIRSEEGREIRKGFIADDGHLLLSADYSQIELRVFAHYSDDPVLIQAFDRGEDIHTRTAAEVFDLDPRMVTPEMRRMAKMINFGIIYGMGPIKLAKELGISKKVAQVYLDNYCNIARPLPRLAPTVRDYVRREKAVVPAGESPAPAADRPIGRVHPLEIAGFHAIVGFPGLSVYPERFIGKTAAITRRFGS